MAPEIGLPQKQGGHSHPGPQPTAVRHQARQSYRRQGHKAAREEAAEDCEFDEPTCVVNAHPAKFIIRTPVVNAVGICVLTQ